LVDLGVVEPVQPEDLSVLLDQQPDDWESSDVWKWKMPSDVAAALQRKMLLLPSGYEPLETS